MQKNPGRFGITQRDLIAILLLLIFISAAIILLISGSRPKDEVDVPVYNIKTEIENIIALRDDNVRSEHKGIVYGVKIEEKKRKEEERKRTLEQQRMEEQILRQIESLDYVPQTGDNVEDTAAYKKVQGEFTWGGPVINSTNGSVTGPSGKETYYNLPMGGVVAIMRGMGNRDKYWVRSDGCKMLGNYIMVAAHLRVHPRGSIVKCSRGYAIVCDTGTFAQSDPYQLDIAVNW